MTTAAIPAPARAPRLPALRLSEEPKKPAPIRAEIPGPLGERVELLLRGYDMLAEAHAAGLELIVAMAHRIENLERKIRDPGVRPDLEPFMFVVPAHENGPMRQFLDVGAYMAAMSERYNITDQT